ncbi:MAG: methyltransferase domain-containing protein, partial [Planctomycetota bacterium]
KDGLPFQGKKDPVQSTLSCYDLEASRLAALYEQAEMQHIHRELQNLFPPGTKVLELGCGSGREGAFLINRGVEVILTDGSKEMLQEASKQHPQLAGKLIHLPLPATFPFPAESFDGVYSLALLMHLPQESLPYLFKEIFRVLKPGGKLFFSVSISRSDINPQGWDQKGRYFLILPEDEWIKLAEDAGFFLIKSHFDPDQLGERKILWLSLFFQK